MKTNNKKPVVGRSQPFEVDARVTLRIQFDLALALGEFILRAGPGNPALYALGLKLNRLAPDEDDREYRQNTPAGSDEPRNQDQEQREGNQDDVVVESEEN